MNILFKVWTRRTNIAEISQKTWARPNRGCGLVIGVRGKGQFWMLNDEFQDFAPL